MTALSRRGALGRFGGFSMAQAVGDARDVFASEPLRLYVLRHRERVFSSAFQVAVALAFRFWRATLVMAAHSKCPNTPPRRPRLTDRRLLRAPMLVSLIGGCPSLTLDAVRPPTEDGVMQWSTGTAGRATRACHGHCNRHRLGQAPSRLVSRARGRGSSVAKEPPPTHMEDTRMQTDTIT